MLTTGLAHIAILTTDLENSISWYEKLGGQCYAKGEVEKPTGTNHLAMVRLPGVDLELIEPGDGTPVEPAGGVIPHFALETDDLDASISQLRELGVIAFVPNSQLSFRASLAACAIFSLPAPAVN